MNTTSIDPSGLSPFLIALRTCFIAIIGLLIISGNILSIAVTRRVSTLADSTKVLMTSLAVYDLLVGNLTIFAFIASALDRWPFGDVVCEIIAVGSTMFFIMSMFSIVYLNIERYIAVTRPYKFPVLCSRGRVITLVLVTSTLMLITAIGLKVTPGLGKPSVYLSGAAVCFLNNGASFKIINIFSLIFVILIPVSIMICIYCRMIKISRDHELRINHNNPNEANNQGNKAMKTFIVVSLSLAVCYTPFLISRVVESLSGVSSPDWLQFIVIWLSFCNSVFNVYIYCLFNQSFRQMAKKIISERLPCCNRSVAPVNIWIVRLKTVTGQMSQRFSKVWILLNLSVCWFLIFQLSSNRVIV